MTKPEVIAFYLPQYHPTPENDRWYGEGFTEWTNVRAAEPLFPGHRQPIEPGELGYYDLRDASVRKRQAELAKEAGISAFCYYHYWFGQGRMMLEQPLFRMLEEKDLKMPFCLCWANHLWYKKTWNAETSVLDQTLLLDINYGDAADWELHFRTLLPAFQDERYYRIDGRLAFVLYRAQDIPQLEEWKSLWNRLVRENGLPEFYFMTYVDDSAKLRDPVQRSCEKEIVMLRANVESFGRTEWMRYASRFVRTWLSQRLGRSLSIFRYPAVRRKLSGQIFAEESVVPTLLPNWDNTARRAEGASVLSESSPEQFYLHCRETFSYLRGKKNKLVFLKSWNEWGEGNYMEPDSVYGRGYIHALRRALDEFYSCGEDIEFIDNTSDILSSSFPTGERGQEVREAYQTANSQSYALLKESAQRMRQSPTQAEDALWQMLRNGSTGYKFRRQHPIGDYVADFMCLEAQLIVEVDGGYHDSSEQMEYDRVRTNALNRMGYEVLRLRNEEVLCAPDSAFELVRITLHSRMAAKERGEWVSSCPMGKRGRKVKRAPLRVLEVCRWKEGYDHQMMPFVYEQGEALRAKGCEVDYFLISKGYLASVRDLRRKIREWSPDVVHAHYGLSAITAELQRLAPTITTFHNGETHSWYINALTSSFSLRAKHAIYVAQHIHDLLYFRHPHYSIMPCGIDLEQSVVMDPAEARCVLGFEPDKRYILFGGAFSNLRKGYPLLAESLELLTGSKGKKEEQLIAFGGGEANVSSYDFPCVNTVEGVRAIRVIEMKGMTRAQLAVMMNACDLFALPTKNEGSPQAMKEAMACNCPVVATDTADIKYLLHDLPGCYVLENKGTSPAFWKGDANSVKELTGYIEDAFRFNGRTYGRQRIIDLGYTNPQVADKLIEIYNQIVINNNV